MKHFLEFFFLIFLPTLLIGAFLGLFFGGVGYYGSVMLDLYETEEQDRLVFWVFFAMGVSAGIYYAGSSLLDFIKHKPK